MKARQNALTHESTKKVRTPKKIAPQQGSILRLKQGYNPNSSSVGSIVFVLPAALLGITTAFGAVSGMIMSALMTDNEKNTKDKSTSAGGGVDE